MYPLFQPSSRVPVKLMPKGTEYEMGDIIVFKGFDSYIIHVVIDSYVYKGVTYYVTGGLNQEFDEPISEIILGFLVDIIDKIDENPDQNPDQIINDYLAKYYERRKPVEHSFSDALIEIVKNDIILNIIEGNKEKFENVSQPVMNKLIMFFKDFFIDGFHKYKNIEVSD